MVDRAFTASPWCKAGDTSRLVTVPEELPEGDPARATLRPVDR